MNVGALHKAQKVASTDSIMFLAPHTHAADKSLATAITIICGTYKDIFLLREGQLVMKSHKDSALVYCWKGASRAQLAGQSGQVDLRCGSLGQVPSNEYVLISRCPLQGHIQRCHLKHDLGLLKGSPKKVFGG